MQPRMRPCGIDAAVLCACHRKLLQLEHRLATIQAIADSMQGHGLISTLRVRLQRMIEQIGRG